MNIHLKRAREAAGLSQGTLAEMLGTTTATISRWERREHQPSAYFREKLSTILGKSPADLGFLPEEAQPKEVVYDPLIPLPPALVGRDDLLIQLRQQVLQASQTTCTLFGLPGVGKTALAAALAYDQKIRRHFDGILWAGLGPEPNLLHLISSWGALLGVTVDESQPDTTEAWWIETLRRTIGSRSLLLIIDDVWKVEDALFFKIGGPNCAYIVTTHFPGVASHLTIDGMTRIEELRLEDGITVLRRLAPQVVNQEEPKIRELVQAVGGLPLALTLIGNYLRKQTYSGPARRITAALERLSHAEERLHLSEVRAPSEPYPGLPTGHALSLQAVISVADHHLPAEARQALHALAVLPAKPHTFSEQTALAVTGSSIETLDVLLDAGLLEWSGEDQYSLHQTIADYARILASLPEKR